MKVGKRDATHGANSWGLVGEGDYLNANPFDKGGACPEPYEGWKLAVRNTFRDRRKRMEKDN